MKLVSYLYSKANAIGISQKRKAYDNLSALSKKIPINQATREKIRKRIFGEYTPIGIQLDSAESTHHSIPVIEFDDTEEKFYEYEDKYKIDPLVKLIAFYLPQFHPFEENDTWWGKGFTEWTNVTKAVPNFRGHYQPHLPIHLGFYDLRLVQVMEEQARIAKNYGIYGFNYYFYWFAGKTLMETPLIKMLENPKVDIPFCLTWANENWTRRWDGAEHDILIAQEHSDDDSLKFISHIMKYFHDSRYIKIDGKPVLIIYRSDIIPNINETTKIWREEVKRNGFPGLYLICAQSFGIQAPDPYDFDASAEFPPHTAISQEVSSTVENLDSNFQGNIYCYEQVVKNAVQKQDIDYKCYRTTMLSWDNTARKQLNSHTFINFSLKLYKQWLNHLCHSIYHDERYLDDEKFVFINAWNEWAEGTHLEPDRKYGFGYLSSTYDVVRHFQSDKTKSLRFPKQLIKKHDAAIIIHVHYSENLPEILSTIEIATLGKADLYFTATSSEIIEKIKTQFPSANTMLVENRGRDILPFIKVYSLIHHLGYTAVCKIHSKRSVYRDDGDTIRNDLLQSLLGSQKTFSKIVNHFSENDSVGLIAVKKYLINHNNHNMTFTREVVHTACEKMGLRFEYDLFPAGSMFWFRPSALEALLSIKSSDFGLEMGLADGTFAHAIERLFVIIAKKSQFSVTDTESINHD